MFEIVLWALVEKSIVASRSKLLANFFLNELKLRTIKIRCSPLKRMNAKTEFRPAFTKSISPHDNDEYAFRNDIIFL